MQEVRLGLIRSQHLKGKSMPKILLLGGTGFIGRNLAYSYTQKPSYEVTLFARNAVKDEGLLRRDNLKMVRGDFEQYNDFRGLVKDYDIVFHLACATTPANSGKCSAARISSDISATANLLEACIREDVGKVVFLSSGGAIYGANGKVPSSENDPRLPLSYYGYQKQAIEELYGYYGRVHGLKHGIVRLSNPYGPLQNPTSGLGVVTNFIHRVLSGDPLQIFGDGSVVRDFIYISDAVRGMREIADYDGCETIFNLGSGCGLSILEVAYGIQEVLNRFVEVEYLPSRVADVPRNYLSMDKYEEIFGPLCPISFSEGVERTARHLRGYQISEKR